jgi:4a-hydroxytetrahydrobiopterin dehydratase
MTHWIEQDNKLIGEFVFKDFSQAWAFMTEVAMLAEKQNHHPEWTNVWNSVRIKLSTHDAGDIVTEKDRKLAESINRVFDRYQDYT